ALPISKGFVLIQTEICDYGRGVLSKIRGYCLNNWKICTHNSYICSHICRCSAVEFEKIRIVQCLWSYFMGFHIDVERLFSRSEIPLDNQLCRDYYRYFNSGCIFANSNCIIEKMAKK